MTKVAACCNPAVTMKTSVSVLHPDARQYVLRAFGPPPHHLHLLHNYLPPLVPYPIPMFVARPVRAARLRPTIPPYGLLLQACPTSPRLPRALQPCPLHLCLLHPPACAARLRPTAAAMMARRSSSVAPPRMASRRDTSEAPNRHTLRLPSASRRSLRAGTAVVREKGGTSAARRLQCFVPCDACCPACSPRCVTAWVLCRCTVLYCTVPCRPSSGMSAWRTRCRTERRAHIP